MKCDLDCGTDLSILHLHFDLVVLPENAPRHARTGHPQFDRFHDTQFNCVGFGQGADERSRGLLLHRSRLQHVVHCRDCDAFHLVSQQVPLCTRLCQHYRLRGDTLLFHRFGTAKVRLASRECRHSRVLLHHPYHETLQTDTTLVRTQDPHTDV